MTEQSSFSFLLDNFALICKNNRQIEREVFSLQRIHRNEKLERMLVWAINKAVADDIPLMFSEHPLDTHNFLGHFRGDCINTNLRLGLNSENVTLLSIQRSGFAGRLIIDHAHKISYSITTMQNVRAIPKKKGRKTPHFLQTLLGIENANYESEYKQLTLMPISHFDQETLQEDYESIIANLISPNEGYVHYIIAYTLDKSGLLDVQLLFLDKDFDIIASENLNEFIAPDYAELTASHNIPDASNIIPEPNVRTLLGLKPGLRLALYDEDDEA